MALEPLELNGKVAWVTGSSRGIGRVIASFLASQGADVAIHGTTPFSTNASVSGGFPSPSRPTPRGGPLGSAASLPRRAPSWATRPPPRFLTTGFRPTPRCPGCVHPEASGRLLTFFSPLIGTTIQTGIWVDI